MRPSELLAALHTAEKLKDTTRHCYTSGGRHESVAEHSWRIALMAFFLRDEFPEADMDKVTRMCLIHDLGECFTGDIPAFDKTAQDESTEEALLYQWVASLPSPLHGGGSARDSRGRQGQDHDTGRRRHPFRRRCVPRDRAGRGRRADRPSPAHDDIRRRRRGLQGLHEQDRRRA